MKRNTRREPRKDARRHLSKLEGSVEFKRALVEIVDQFCKQPYWACGLKQPALPHLGGTPTPVHLIRFTLATHPLSALEALWMLQARKADALDSPCPLRVLLIDRLRTLLNGRKAL